MSHGLAGGYATIPLSAVGTKVPPTVSKAFVILASGALLMHSTLFAVSLHPADAATAFHTLVSFGLNDVAMLPKDDWPLNITAARNGGLGEEAYALSCVSTDSAPADSPQMVTLLGEPPNEAALA